MSANAPQWDLARAERLAAELRAVDVPAHAEAFEDDVYLCLPVWEPDLGEQFLVTVWWTGDMWQDDVGYADDPNSTMSGGLQTKDDLTDAQVAGLLLARALTLSIGTAAYTGPSDI